MYSGGKVKKSLTYISKPKKLTAFWTLTKKIALLIT